MKKLKSIPRFQNEDAEREFWATHDSSGYINWRKAERAVFPNLRPSVKIVSIRLPQWLIYRLKALANSKDVPYQSLMKIFLVERVEKELKLTR